MTTTEDFLPGDLVRLDYDILRLAQGDVGLVLYVERDEYISVRFHATKAFVRVFDNEITLLSRAAPL